MTNWVEISARNLETNFRALSDAAPGVAVLAVIKADGYGHGAGLCAAVLALTGARWLGATDVAEGAAVRAALVEAGVALADQPRILLMSGLLEDDASPVIAHGLTPVVWTREQLSWLASAAAEPLAVHLEIDTGMARQGVAPGAELMDVLGVLAGSSALRLEAVMTHFASAEVAGSRQTAHQQRLFEQALEQVVAAGLRPGCIHAGNTSGVDNVSGEESSLAWLRRIASKFQAEVMVRTGLGLYGYSLSVECEAGFAGDARAAVRSQLKPVMTWKARVIGLRDVPAGTQVGYNGTFTTPAPMRLALLPVGYADGLRRELSATRPDAGGWVMLHGRRAPIVGRVSMNLTIVDVTALPEVAVGDEAVVLGEGMTADDHAALAGTISYEILCGIKAPRHLA